MKIPEQFLLTTEYEMKIAYDTNTICTVVTNKWQRFVAQCNNDLCLCVRERLPLLEPTPDGIVFNVPSRATIIDAAVAAAAAASAEAPNASMEVCFCCLDSPMMALVSLKCCK
jgi:hypothetical protein